MPTASMASLSQLALFYLSWLASVSDKALQFAYPDLDTCCLPGFGYVLPTQTWIPAAYPDLDTG